MNWSTLKGETVSGSHAQPLVVAFHGFGQYVLPKWWQRPGYWCFPVMSDIVEECRRRDWSCWMPEAPYRDWKPRHVDDETLAGFNMEWESDSIETVARHKTGSDGPIVYMGFSDGATLVNRLMAYGSATYVSYSGCMPWGVSYSMSHGVGVLLCGNVGEPERIREHTARMRAALPMADSLDGDSSRHAWLPSLNERIFDWVEMQ